MDWLDSWHEKQAWHSGLDEQMHPEGDELVVLKAHRYYRMYWVIQCALLNVLHSVSVMYLT